MKRLFKSYLAIIALTAAFAWSCAEYLDLPPEAELTQEEIYKDPEKFMSFIDVCYSYIVDYNTHALTTTMNVSNETMGNPTMGWTSQNKAATGNYKEWWNQLHSNYQGKGVVNPVTGDDPSGEWDAWKGIRIANLTIENIAFLEAGTDEQRDHILGQAYFFRGFFHWILVKSFGGMTYIDKAFKPEDDMTEYSRLTYQETVDLFVKDFEKADSLLPWNWAGTDFDNLAPGRNIGRATRGTARGFKAKALLYAGSPLQNGFSTGSFTYNDDYMKRAADAAWELIAEGASEHPLTDWGTDGETYLRMFARNDGSYPWEPEVLFAKIDATNSFIHRIGRVYTPNKDKFGGVTGNVEGLNQLYADKWEMADGSLYKPGLKSQGGYDDTDSLWNHRDPRFRANIWVDGDNAGLTPTTVFTFYDGGVDREWQTGVAQQTPYAIHKFWPFACNKVDGNNSFICSTPRLRMAEIYLIYAEAVTVAYGPGQAAPGASMTAVQAVNEVRGRCGMPAVSADAPGYSISPNDAAAINEPNFLALIRNEYWSEFCFEGTWIFNMKRWYIQHLKENRQYYDLKFDEGRTYFNRIRVKEMVFENPKHYWMPLPSADVKIWDGFRQNPGWE